MRLWQAIPKPAMCEGTARRGALDGARWQPVALIRGREQAKCNHLGLLCGIAQKVLKPGRIERQGRSVL
jgi:hypothetical protein